MINETLFGVDITSRLLTLTLFTTYTQPIFAHTSHETFSRSLSYVLCLFFFSRTVCLFELASTNPRPIRLSRFELTTGVEHSHVHHVQTCRQTIIAFWNGSYFNCVFSLIWFLLEQASSLAVT